MRTEKRMIKLRNIKKNGKEIQCDFLVEDCAEYGRLAIDIATEKAEYSIPEGYECCEHHIRKAYRYLLDNQDDLPSIRNIVWY